MASEKMKRVSTLVNCLSMDILEQLGMKLNPRHPMKDFRYLAGKMNYNYESVRNFERQKNPTVSLLYEWWMSSERNGEVKTVTHLIELLKSMGRDDAVNILRPVEFTELSQYPSGKDYQPTHVTLPPEAPFPIGGNLFGAYSTGDLKETRPPQENEYLYNNNLTPPRPACYVGDDGRSRPYQEIIANVQHTMFSDYGSPLALEPRPQVRHPATDRQNGSDLQDGNVVLEPSSMRQPSTAPESPPRPVVSDKVALVIGNQQYECGKLKGLFYAEKDAYDVAQVLFTLGFKVVALVNLSLSEMRIAVLSFCRLLGKGVYGVLYYAGHGYEDGGENFLLPVDANLKYNRQDSLRAQEILETMQACDTALNLLIIDSCRIRLPKKTGTVHYCKRGPKGNNIFAYSCCSQQEAYEEPNQPNGLYATHLLRHIRRNERIELILMDVARDVSRASSRNLIQRPCHESDAVADCRLTDPIVPDLLPEEFGERMKLWNQAHYLPDEIPPIDQDGLVISFECRPVFSNVMEIKISAHNTNPAPLQEVVMDLQVPTPVMSKVRLLSGELLGENGGVLEQVVQLSRLQKLLDPLVVTFKMYYRMGNEVRDWEKTVRLGCPLVSSVFVQWDWWITCGRLPGVKCTQV